MTRHTKRRMEPVIFDLALKRLGTRGASYDAARLVMVDGMRVAEVGQRLNLRRQSVYEAIDKIEGVFKNIGVCGTCGQRLPSV